MITVLMKLIISMKWICAWMRHTREEIHRFWILFGASFGFGFGLANWGDGQHGPEHQVKNTIIALHIYICLISVVTSFTKYTGRVTVAYSMNDHENRGIKFIKGYRQLYKVLKWYLWLFEYRVQHSIFALFTRTVFFVSFHFILWLLSLYRCLFLALSLAPSHNQWNVTICIVAA